MDLDFTVIWSHRAALLTGLGNTLLITLATTLSGALLGGMAALARHLAVGPLRWLALGYIIGVRALPDVVLIFWLYSCLPLLLDLSLSALATGILTLTLVHGAYFAEVLRSGIQAVPPGQWEAGRALGLNTPSLWSWIVLPQALQLMMPALLTFVVNVIKGTGLLATINVGELVYHATLVSAETFRYFEVLTVMGFFYFCLILPLSIAAQWLERRLY
ncbi:MAG: amino acid ABC transporter permease [Candidatus Competibacterales bacterium]